MVHEFSALGILFSPWLPAGAGGSVLALVTAWLLNRTGDSRFFRLHQWIFLSFLVLYACMIYRWGLD